MTTRQQLLDACEAEARGMTDEELRADLISVRACRTRGNLTRGDLEALVGFALYLRRVHELEVER